jgi:hypothetical protein
MYSVLALRRPGLAQVLRLGNTSVDSTDSGTALDDTARWLLPRVHEFSDEIAAVDAFRDPRR